MTWFGALDEARRKKEYIEDSICPKCSSDNTGFSKECYEDEHHEMIEAYLFCYDCGWSEI